VSRSYDRGEFGERGRDAIAWLGFDPEFVVASLDVLHERVAVHDHPREVVPLEAAHRMEPRLQAAVVSRRLRTPAAAHRMMADREVPVRLCRVFGLGWLSVRYSTGAPLSVTSERTTSRRVLQPDGISPLTNATMPPIAAT
jgi:hypothetical protein